MRSSRTIVALIFASVLVHAGVIAWTFVRAERIDSHAFQSLDSEEYFQIARNIVEHGQFSQSKFAPIVPDTWRTPGYPLFLAGAMLLVGDCPSALIVIQHLLCVASVILFFQIASLHMSLRRAVIASGIFLLEPYHTFYASWLLSTAFFTFTLLGAWLAWEHAIQRRTARHLVFAGLFSGFLVLIWPGAILIPAFLSVGISLARKSSIDADKRSSHHQVAKAPLQPVPALVMLLLVCALPMMSWMIRNKVVAGHFALSHQSGIVLAYFKATEVELWRQGRTADRYVETSLNPANRDWPHRVWDDIDAKLCQQLEEDLTNCADLRWYNLAQGNKTSRQSLEISQQLSAIGRSMLLASPVSTLSCGLTRIGENLVFPLGLLIAPANEAPVHRLKSAAMGGAYALLSLAAIVGVVRARWNFAAGYFPLCCLIALALTTSPQIDPRFRVPMIPLLAFMALLPARRGESE